MIVLQCGRHLKAKKLEAHNEEISAQAQKDLKRYNELKALEKQSK